MSYSQPAPAQGDKLDFKTHGQEYLGRLFLIFPSRIMNNVETSQGTKDRVVIADVVILDLVDPQTGQPTVFHEAWLFGTVLVNQTAPEVGNKVLGRLSQGQNVKGNPPWMLQDYTPQDVAMAEQYEASHPRNAPAQPSGNGNAPQQAWQQDAWGGLNAAPPASNGQWQAPQQSPPQGQWTPAPAPAATPPVAPAPAPAMDPNLKAFLEQRGVDVSKIPDENTARQIAASFPQ